LDTEHVNKWVALLANIGVLAGIAFLAFEIRLSNRIAVATAEMSIREYYFAINELSASNIRIAGLLARARESNAQFSPAEAEQLDGYVFMNVNTWRAIEIAYASGLLPRETFESIEAEAIDILRWWPGLRPFMQSAADTFTEDDDRYVTQALRRALALQE